MPRAWHEAVETRARRARQSMEIEEGEDASPGRREEYGRLMTERKICSITATSYVKTGTTAPGRRARTLGSRPRRVLSGPKPSRATVSERVGPACLDSAAGPRPRITTTSTAGGPPQDEKVGPIGSIVGTYAERTESSRVSLRSRARAEQQRRPSQTTREDQTVIASGPDPAAAPGRGAGGGVLLRRRGARVPGGQPERGARDVWARGRRGCGEARA